MKYILFMLVLPALCFGQINVVEKFAEKEIEKTEDTGPAIQTKSIVDVTQFGAKGDGVTDDTKAFQNAFNAAVAARAKVIIPAAPNHYKLTNTILVQNHQSGQAWIDVEGWGWGIGQSLIAWYGPSNKPVFQLIGLKQGMWNGLKIGVNNGISGVSIFDVDTRDEASSTTGVTFKNMYLNLGDKANIGFRIGHSWGGNGDISNLQFENIAIYGKQDVIGGVPGQIGYVVEGQNTLSLTWMGGFVSHVDRIYTNKSTAGAKQDRGNGSAYFYGLGASSNNVDFEIAFEQEYLISGGRFEASRKFLQVVAGGYSSITIENCTIHESQTTAKIIDVQVACDVSLMGVHIIRPDQGLPQYKNVISLSANGRNGSLFVRGGQFSTNTLYSKTGTTIWDITVIGASKADGVWSNGFFVNEIGVRK